MVTRSVRIALLALAAWAVLFAPGAASDLGVAQVAASADDVAAAIIAPTFGPDGVVLARTMRDSADDLADDVVDPFVVAVVVVIACTAATVRIRLRAGTALARTLRCSLPQRAPPVI